MTHNLPRIPRSRFSKRQKRSVRTEQTGVVEHHLLDEQRLEQKRKTISKGEFRVYVRLLKEKIAKREEENQRIRLDVAGILERTLRERPIGEKKREETRRLWGTFYQEMRRRIPCPPECKEAFGQLLIQRMRWTFEQEASIRDGVASIPILRECVESLILNMRIHIRELQKEEKQLSGKMDEKKRQAQLFSQIEGLRENLPKLRELNEKIKFYQQYTDMIPLRGADQRVKSKGRSTQKTYAQLWAGKVPRLNELPEISPDIFSQAAGEQEVRLNQLIGREKTNRLTGAELEAMIWMHEHRL